MLTFNIGSFVISLSHLLLFVALLTATMIGRRVATQGKQRLDSVLFWLFMLGLLVARLSFVLIYREQYGDDLWRIVDIRDGGFHALSGSIAVVFVALLWGWRNANLRRPLAASVISGMLLWGLGTLSLNVYEQGTRLPEIPVRTIKGETVDLTSFQGRPLVINLWATWCPPCRREMPVLQKAQAENPHLTFLFVNQGEGADIVNKFLSSQSLRLDNILFDGGGRLGQVVGSMALPTTLFYSADGRLIKSHLGELSDASLTHVLKQFENP
ncbi:prolipoprotein diacylglyceryl transferase family protein [Pseudomonas sp. NPDC087612]|uniref:prolipoprotein diacylglyceryl transferase family protein n=1 Tax=Pseudomonas sp. NPDC087612 TaxID=3364441 RepID=UPI0037F76766